MVFKIKDSFIDSIIGRRIKKLTLQSIEFFLNQNIKIRKRNARGFYVACRAPTIVFTSELTHEIELFSKEIADENAYFFIIFYSSLLSQPQKIKLLERGHFKQIKSFPNHKLFYLCNTEEEYHLVRRFHYDAYFINDNALVDTSIFSIKSSNKTYDLIYNARLNKSKRHYLIPTGYKTALISAPILNFQKEVRYLNYLKKLLNTVWILNTDPPKLMDEISIEELEKLPMRNNNDLVKWINQSKVGLILSAMEGANYATIEYLLCGIPVVSTYNIGGRDVFLKNPYCRIVPSSRKKIKEAIKEIIKSDYSPEDIRNTTLKVMEEHRNRLKSLLNEILKNENVSMDVDQFWNLCFTHKMIRMSNFPEIYLHELDTAPNLQHFSNK